MKRLSRKDVLQAGAASGRALLLAACFDGRPGRSLNAPGSAGQAAQG